MLLAGHEEIPQALGLRALAQLDEDARVGNAGADLVVERLKRLELDRVEVLVEERSIRPRSSSTRGEGEKSMGGRLHGDASRDHCAVPGVPEDTIARRLRIQAEWCGRLGSPLYESLLMRCAADVEADGPVGRLLAEPSADAWGGSGGRWAARRSHCG